jgi:ribosomal protein S18 acetylase RimI-like enzyme
MIHFSEARKEDIPGMIEVMKNTGYVNFAYKNQSDKDIEKDILSSKERTYLICYEKKLATPKKIIGYFIFVSVENHLNDAKKNFFIDHEYAYHLGIGIHSDYRGRRLGMKLTEFALKTAEKKGFRGMYADVASNNHASLKLQEKTGFQKIAEYRSKKRPAGVNNVLFVRHFT